MSRRTSKRPSPPASSRPAAGRPCGRARPDGSQPWVTPGSTSRVVSTSAPRTPRRPTATWSTISWTRSRRTSDLTGSSASPRLACRKPPAGELEDFRARPRACPTGTDRLFLGRSLWLSRVEVPMMRRSACARLLTPALLFLLAMPTARAENVAVLSHHDRGERYSGVWGYTAPNGTELVISGTEFGTSFLDATDPENA